MGMKKVLLAFDGTNVYESAFNFACQLNEIKPILLIGAFLPKTSIANLWSYADGIRHFAYAPLMEEDNAAEVQRNITAFEKRCVNNGIDYRVHTNFSDSALNELINESRFADVLILSSEAFYDKMGTDFPNDYLRDVLHNIECPVLIVPEDFEFPTSVVLAYDGGAESVFAIKQFAYLFPELNIKETILVYANSDVEKDFPSQDQIEELATRHYKNLTLTKLDIDPKKYFATWLSEKPGALLVSGSYGRSGFSQLFNKSFVRDIIAEHRLLIFIAHK
jgi:hypothetical protein